MNRRNYQRELEAVIKENEGKSRVPRLLLHSCCAPCSSYVLEYLSDYFEITVFYYNPNISPAEEYEKRAAEQQHLIRELPVKYPVQLIVGAYEPERFYDISPLKNAGKLNEIGEELSAIYKVEHLPSDFKKKNGYKRSVELSAEYGLYRQNYCGCVFSKREQELRERETKKESQMATMP